MDNNMFSIAGVQEPAATLINPCWVQSEQSLKLKFINLLPIQNISSELGGKFGIWEFNRFRVSSE